VPKHDVKVAIGLDIIKFGLTDMNELVLYARQTPSVTTALKYVGLVRLVV
jgi:hypothetical protein